MWIDAYSYTTVGSKGFLVEAVHWLEHAFSLNADPPRTNGSYRPTLVGWCGEDNNISIFGRGAWRVVKLSKSGERALIARLRGDELKVFLEESGYPELFGDDE